MKPLGFELLGLKPLALTILGDAAIGVLTGVVAFHVLFAVLAKAAVMVLVISGPCGTSFDGPMRGVEDWKRIKKAADRFDAAEPDAPTTERGTSCSDS